MKMSQEQHTRGHLESNGFYFFVCVFAYRNIPVEPWLHMHVYAGLHTSILKVRAKAKSI